MIPRLKKALLRFRQWRAAVKLAGAEARLWPMLKALRTGGVGARQYRNRLRICARCPIYDRERKLCRMERVSAQWLNNVFTQRKVVLGCGCYVPYLAKTRAPYQAGIWPGVKATAGCWGRAAIGGTFGWGEKEDAP